MRGCAGAWSRPSCERRDITDERILKAMGLVQRQRLMPMFIDQAYEDHPVPIGYSHNDQPTLHRRAHDPGIEGQHYG